jgi:hypothetical protein
MLNFVKSILGESVTEADVVKNVNKKGGQIFISKKLAEQMLTARRAHIKKGRSTHLENRRTLFRKNEGILDPFLVQEPRAVMSQYFEDVEKRIAYAKELALVMKGHYA